MAQAQDGGPGCCGLRSAAVRSLHNYHLEKCEGPTLTMTGITGPDAGRPAGALRAPPFVTCWSPSPASSVGASLQAWQGTPCADGDLTFGPPALLVWHAYCLRYASGGDARPRVIGLGRAC